jgi:hypothetical protein
MQVPPYEVGKHVGETGLGEEMRKPTQCSVSEMNFAYHII